MILQPLKIGDLTIRYPIIQGGMGVGISRSQLAGAVSANGGLGIISTAQIGYDEPDFEKDQKKANLKAIKKHIERAKEISGGKPVGVNIMVATKDYPDYVRASAEAGADVIISGAGLPIRMPEYIEGSDCKIAPIVSSEKAARLMLRGLCCTTGRKSLSGQQTSLLSRDQKREVIWDFAQRKQRRLRLRNMMEKSGKSLLS